MKRSKWESVNTQSVVPEDGVTRLKIEGGWLYRDVFQDANGDNHCSTVFVPDVDAVIDAVNGVAHAVMDAD